MGLETNFNFIDDFNETFPNSSPDTLAQADDHMRGIKKGTKGSFPNLGQAAVTGTAADLNAYAPIGGIIMFTGLLSSLTSGWAFCDGTNGTVDLRDSFILGATIEGEIGDTGGSADAIVVSHDHTANHDHPNATTTNDGTHTHTVPYTSAGGSGTSTISGDTDIAADNELKTTNPNGSL